MRKLGLAAGLAALAVLTTGGNASAAITTVGADLSGPPTGSPFGCGAPGGCTYAQNTPAFVSPVSGTILRWRVYSLGGSFTLRVIRGNTGIAKSSPMVTPSSGVFVFPTSLPISAGDRIGVDMPDDLSSELAVDSPASGGVDTWTPQLANGTTAAPVITYTNYETLLNVDILPAPKVSAIGIASGPIGGGTTVVITGTDFLEVKSVNFGATPANFKVDSENQVTATSPAGSPGAAAISVTTTAGTAVSPTSFTYTACIVPKLKGKTLKADRKRLRKAGCALGKVRGERYRGAKVKKQTRPPGTVLPPGAKVGVKLG